MSERYEFNATDRELLRAASDLLQKAAAATTTAPAQVVSIAKLQHVLSILPRVSAGLEVSVSVSSPRSNFGEIETWHWWKVATEGGRLAISAGGHFYQPSTGGDTFATMSWAAVPEEPAELNDYRDTLWMVPDVQSFPDAVAGIDFASGGYSIEVTDSDNSLLEEEESEDEDTDDRADGDAEDEVDEEPEATEDTPLTWLITPIDTLEERSASIVDPEQVDVQEPAHAYSVQNCDFCGCVLEHRAGCSWMGASKATCSGGTCAPPASKAAVKASVGATGNFTPGNRTANGAWSPDGAPRMPTFAELHAHSIAFHRAESIAEKIGVFNVSFGEDATSV